MHSNFVKRLLKAAWVLELVVAVLILAVTLLELFLLGEGTLSQVLGGSFSADAFFADAMTIVVGIEFVKMLMLHTPRAVTDVLLFAIARQLGLDGYNIVMVATGPQEKNQAAVDALQKQGVCCAYVQANIGDHDDRLRILDAALSAFGRVDALVNNAGVACKMFEALSSAGVNINMISTSEIKVSVLVDEREADRAVQAIHDRFFNEFGSAN